MNFWLIKSDPETYSWEDFERDQVTVWDGVRSFQARNNLKAMKKGDLLLFYLSNSKLGIMGTAVVEKEAFQDPTTTDPNWVAIEIRLIAKFSSSVSLESIKAEPLLQNIGLVKQSRLSVMPLTKEELEAICRLIK